CGPAPVSGNPPPPADLLGRGLRVARSPGTSPAPAQIRSLGAPPAQTLQIPRPRRPYRQALLALRRPSRCSDGSPQRDGNGHPTARAERAWLLEPVINPVVQAPGLGPECRSANCRGS